MESLQRDRLAWVKAVDAFQLLVSKTTIHVSVRSLDLTPTLIFNPPEKNQKKKSFYRLWENQIKHVGRHAQAYFHRDFVSVCPKRIDFNYTFVYSVNARLI